MYLRIGKTATLDIKETLAKLTSLLSKQKTLTGEKRIKSLIYIKNNKFKTRQEVSDYLSIHIRTLERWIHTYKTAGIDKMIHDKPKNKKSKIITNEIHQGLAQRVNDPHNPFWDIGMLKYG